MGGWLRWLLLALGFTPVSPLPCGRQSKQITFGGLERTYVLRIPQAACSSERAKTSQLESLPIVVALHCKGCTSASILDVFENAAEQYNMALLAPDGVDQSFNAQVCCGTAVEQGIDDVGFIRELLLQVHRGKVAPDMQISFRAIYAVGFSNGGFLASHLAQLREIRGFVALAGHVYKLPSKKKAVSIHWMKTDSVVNYNGCCSTRSCCCGINQRWSGPCIGAEAIFQKWLEINGCGGDLWENNTNGAECRVGSGCSRPTRLCSYALGTHADWTHEFQDASNVLNFLAKDACSIGGSWDHGANACQCRSGMYGKFCQDGRTNAANSDHAVTPENHGYDPWQDIVLIGGLAASVLGIVGLTRSRLRFCMEDDDDDDYDEDENQPMTRPTASRVGVPAE